MAWWEGVDETRLLIAPVPGETGNGTGQMLSLRHPKSDGSLYTATPVDPVFIFLPIFEEARMKCSSYAVSILGEYMKDEPWLKLLCNHLKLDLAEVNRKHQMLKSFQLLQKVTQGLRVSYREKGATKRVQELESKLKWRKWRQNQRTSKKCFPGRQEGETEPL